MGATAALLLVGGGAGVLALTTAPVSPTVRTTPSDGENGAFVSTLPPVSELHDVSDADTSDEQSAPTTTAAPAPVLIEPPAPEPASEEAPEAPEPVETTPAPRPTAVTAPVVTSPPANVAPEPPTPTAAPEPAAPAPPAPTSQVLSSACGDVVVEIDGRTISIASITPLAGYTSRVSTDGPESVEMKFVGTDDGCEVHAELKAGGLDVEIQNSDHDDD